jgi:hypothetical protein
MNKATDNALESRLRLCLFFCRLGVFIVFLIWTYNKLIRPEYGVYIMSEYYLIPNVPEILILIFGGFELIMCLLFVLGFYKRLTRGFFLFLSVLAISSPEVIRGYFTAILVEAHPTILFFTGLCLFACSFMVYYLRDYDTRFSLAKQENGECHE